MHKEIQIVKNTTILYEPFVSYRKQEAKVFLIFKAIKENKLSAIVSVGGIYTITYLLGRIFKQNDVHQPELNEKVRMGLNGQLDLA